MDFIIYLIHFRPKHVTKNIEDIITSSYEDDSEDKNLFEESTIVHKVLVKSEYIRELYNKMYSDKVGQENVVIYNDDYYLITYSVPSEKTLFAYMYKRETLEEYLHNINNKFIDNTKSYTIDNIKYSEFLSLKEDNTLNGSGTAHVNGYSNYNNSVIEELNNGKIKISIFSEPYTYFAVSNISPTYGLLESVVVKFSNETINSSTYLFNIVIVASILSIIIITYTLKKYHDKKTQEVKFNERAEDKMKEIEKYLEMIGADDND